MFKQAFGVPLLILLVSSTLTGATFEDLARRIPRSVNAVGFMNVKKIHESPLAKREGWKQKHADAYANRPLFLPPGASRLVIGARISTVDKNPLWEIAVIEMDQMPSMSGIAATEGGYVDHVGGVEAVWTPLDAYFLKFSSDLMGVIQPADRQFAARWANESVSQPTVLSPYLQQAVAAARQNDVAILLALDLTDKVKGHELEDTIDASEVIAGAGAGRAALLAVISTLRGARLEVKIDQQATGTLIIEFGTDAGLLTPFAKALVLETMSDAGAGIGDLEQWNANVDGTSITLTGNLTADGLRRIFSVVELPSPATQSEPTDPKQATLAHFQAVRALIEDLQKYTRTSGVGMWMDRYARKIEDMPILKVDTDMQDYSAYVAQVLRDGTDKLNQIKVRFKSDSRNLRSNVSSQSTRYRSGHRTRDAREHERDRQRADQADVIQRRKQLKDRYRDELALMTQDALRQINGATAEIRRKMTQKYEVEF